MILSNSLSCQPPAGPSFGGKSRFVATKKFYLKMKPDGMLYHFTYVSIISQPARVSPFGQLLPPKLYMFQIHMSISETSLSLLKALPRKCMIHKPISTLLFVQDTFKCDMLLLQLGPSYKVLSRPVIREMDPPTPSKNFLGSFHPAHPCSTFL